MPTSSNSSLGDGAYGGTPEALIVALARTGDVQAFEALVRARQSWLRNLMRKLCGDPTLADDLAQQTLLLAWRDLHALQDPRRFSAWLKRLAVNSWLKHLRKNDPLRNALREEAVPRTAVTAGVALGLDLDQALSTLSPSERLCVVLSHYEGMSHAEIAKVSGFALGTVKSHIRRGLLHLRGLLEEYASAETMEIEDE